MQYEIVLNFTQWHLRSLNVTKHHIVCTPINDNFRTFTSPTNVYIWSHSSLIDENYIFPSQALFKQPKPINKVRITVDEFIDVY